METELQQSFADEWHEAKVTYRLAFYMIFIGLLILTTALISVEFTVVDGLLFIISVPLIAVGKIILFTIKQLLSRHLTELAIIKYGMIVGALIPIAITSYNASTLPELTAYAIIMTILFSLMWAGAFVFLFFQERKIEAVQRDEQVS